MEQLSVVTSPWSDEEVITGVFGADMADGKLRSMLAEVVLSRVPPALGAVLESDVSLGAQVQELHRQAEAAWRGVFVEPELFAAYLADRLKDEDGLGALSKLRTDDLYLACACCLGDDAALTLLETTYIDDISKGVEQFDRNLKDEVLQMLRTKLLTAESGSVPRIANYSGRGSLRGWLRVSAMRIAIDLSKKTAREVELVDEYDVGKDAGADVVYLKERCREPFKAAFQEAMESLSPEDRTLLKMTVIDGLTTIDLGKLYRVHRTTAARWVSRARDNLARRTKNILRQKLNVHKSELESIIDLVRSRIDLSLERILASERDAS
jgi:RNA polymerase sigma-70 factor (ECF subfamily)